jgi:hypothetical protein
MSLEEALGAGLVAELGAGGQQGGFDQSYHLESESESYTLSPSVFFPLLLHLIQ